MLSAAARRWIVNRAVRHRANALHPGEHGPRNRFVQTRIRECQRSAAIQPKRIPGASVEGKRLIRYRDVALNPLSPMQTLYRQEDKQYVAQEHIGCAVP
ncbi:hypothetical protein [Paraburkholderia eburnea]|uniref:hypothetical protein n=1 Tax=Paraburkholderia eburnea TaxID=1189126 RepID=UPI0011B044C9|nr:hypothetical protein [Paraburkholderia eburnea]